MNRFLIATLIIASAAFSLAAQQPQKKKDKSVHHAAMHAEHWLDRHASAAHHKHASKPRAKSKSKKKDKSTHHAAMHAEHWLDHHVSAPHKKSGG